MSAQRFEDAEDAYLSWLERNPAGYVVNTRRRPDPSYAVLHRASCAAISTAHGNYTTTSYVKVCAPTVRALENWARTKLGGALTRCSRCEAPPAEA